MSASNDIQSTISPVLAHANAHSSQELRHRAQVRGWLYFSTFVLLVLVVVGGATRLTDSGLSITQWKPIHGVIPPLNMAQWEEELELYRQIPEYQLQNKGMSMADFQFIYWWEWGHRFLARALGLIVGLPLIFFWVTRRLDKRIRLQTASIFLLICVQGAIGWWMVASGLTERVDVSHYRLATHLSMAALILGVIIWTARALAPHAPDLKPTAQSHRAAFGLVVLCFAQIWLGAMVAGMDAGLVFNEWPKMGDGYFPGTMWEQALGWQNWFENPAIVQFAHRTGAYVLFAAVFVHMVAAWRFAPRSTHAWRAAIFFAFICAQALVGIITLVMVVPLSWALLHQGMAFALFAYAVAHWRAMVGPMPLQDGRAHLHGVG